MNQWITTDKQMNVESSNSFNQKVVHRIRFVGLFKAYLCFDLVSDLFVVSIDQPDSVIVRCKADPACPFKCGERLI